VSTSFIHYFCHWSGFFSFYAVPIKRIGNSFVLHKWLFLYLPIYFLLQQQ
jgi:hypothetical protein